MKREGKMPDHSSLNQTPSIHHLFCYPDPGCRGSLNRDVPLLGHFLLFQGETPRRDAQRSSQASESKWFLLHVLSMPQGLLLLGHAETPHLGDVILVRCTNHFSLLLLMW